MVDAVVAVEVDLHLAVGIEVLLPAAGADVVLEEAAAPDGEVDLVLAVVVGRVVPDLLHRRVLLGEDRPLPRHGVEPRGAGGGRGPDVVVLDGDAVHDVVDEPAVHLVPVVEAAAREPREAAAEQAEPDVARLPVDVDRGHDLEREAVLLLPDLHDLARRLVDLGEAVLGADPHARAVDLHREDVVVRQAVGHREGLPVRVDVRQLRRPRGRGRGRLGGAGPRGEAGREEESEGGARLHRLCLLSHHSVFRYSMRSFSWSFVMSFV
ncbi:MAG: hypothetical protein U0599_12945 [Vicinamibacteria bacterium]